MIHKKNQSFSNLPTYYPLQSSMDLTILLAWLFIAALVSFLHFLIFRRIKRRELKPKVPPGPTKLPIIGNLHQVGDLTHRPLWLLSQKYGPLMHLQIGKAPILVVSSADMAREILKINDLGFCSRPRLTSSNKFSYDCKDISFAPYGEYWREMRKMCILQLFSTKRISSFQSIREEEIFILIDSISNSLSVPINLTTFVSNLTSNIICRVALSVKSDQTDLENEHFHALLQEAETLFGSFFISDCFPSLGWIDKLTGLQQRLEKTFNKFDSFYDKVIEDHINQNRTNQEEDIVDMLLHLQKNSPYVTKTNIKAILKDIVVAGIGTSSAVIIWAMAELMRNSKIMQKAQEEVRCSVHISKGNIEKGSLHQLHYLKSVVKETLRLHLPVPLLLPREAIRHCKISGYDIEQDTWVYINAWGIARDPKTWDNPEEFLPERFIDSSIDFKGHDFELIPFGSGRRSCPGMNFGMATVELALTNLLYYFDWKLPNGMSRDDMDMDEVPGITVHKRSPLCLVASRPT